MFQKFISAPLTAQKSASLKQNSGLKRTDGINNFVDFSGTWVGKCAGDEQDETIHIEHSDFDFTVENQHHQIGSLETEATSNEIYTRFSHSLLEWDENHSQLLVNGSFVYYDHIPERNNKEFGYWNGSVSLKNDQLIMQFNSQSSAKNDNTVCTYSKQ